MYIVDKIIEYFQANPLYFWIAIAIAAVLVILIIIAIACGVHSSKKKKREAQKSRSAEPVQQSVPATPSASPQETSVPQTEPAPTAITAEPDTVLEPETKSEPEAMPEPEEVIEPEAAQAPEQAAWEEPPAPVEVKTEPAQEEEASAELPPEHKQSEPTPAKEQEQTSEKKSPSKKSAPNTRKANNASQKTAPKAVSPHKAEETADEQSAAMTDKPEDQEEKRLQYAGKWVIERNEDGSYRFELRASNGEKLLSSIDYASLSGAKSGIVTHKTNILKDDHIVISRNKKGQYFFKLLNGSKQLLCTGETYQTRARCESAVESVKRFAETAVVTVQKKPKTKPDGENEEA